MIQPKNIHIDKIDQLGVVLDVFVEESSVSDIKNILKNNINEEDDPLIISPRLYIRSDINQKNFVFNAIVAGINFKTELEARPSWNLIIGKWPEKDGEAVVGGNLSRLRDISSGDKIVINNKVFKITGILQEYNSPEDHMIFASLQDIQSLFKKEGLVSVINIQNVSLDRDNKLLELVLQDLNSNIPNIKALSPQQFRTMKYIMLKKTYKFLITIILATLIVSIFSIFNIVTTALYTKVREIGLFKSSGASWFQLLRVFLYEYSFIGLTGGAIGYATGLLSSWLLDTFLLKLGASIRIHLVFIFISLLVGTLCSLIASFYPTYKLCRLKITETFRTQWEV
jgi:putative ABC transport system permease protein